MDSNIKYTQYNRQRGRTYIQGTSVIDIPSSKVVDLITDRDYSWVIETQVLSLL